MRNLPFEHFFARIAGRFSVNGPVFCQFMRKQCCHIFRLSLAPFCGAWLLLGLRLGLGLCLIALALPLTAWAQNPPAKPKEIEQAISEAQSKAAAGKAGLSKLSDRERDLNAGLAAAEDRISTLERDLAQREAQLEILETAQKDNLRTYDVLAASKAETESELLALLSFLWPVHNLQESVGLRDGALWSDAEREYTWTAELMRAIAHKQAALKEHEAALSDNLSQREVLSRELRDQVAAIRADKETLLADMLKFNQDLAVVRQEKQDLESTLLSINQTIDNLNVQLELSAAAEAAAAEAARAEAARAEAARVEAARAEEAQRRAQAQTQAQSGEKTSGGKPETVAAATAESDKNAAADSGLSSGAVAGSGTGTGGIVKGKTPWPAKGRVVVRYAPGASPPVRGIGMSMAANGEVRAVAWGKVVHSDVLRGLGYVVVLMHPKQYYTVYAHLTGSPYKVGQEVKQGAVLGRAGHYPPAGGPGIYFELRSHEKAVNPETWLARR